MHQDAYAQYFIRAGKRKFLSFTFVCTNCFLGDAGGPLVCQRKDSCSWYVAGITSFGRGCGRAGFFGVYANLFHYEKWIRSVLVNESSELCKSRQCHFWYHLLYKGHKLPNFEYFKDFNKREKASGGEVTFLSCLVPEMLVGFWVDRISVGKNI